jgi:HAD superfamily hydrolase (TIGR01457 family)
MLFERYGSLLLDLDGVVFRGREPVGAAVATLAELRERGARLAFLTNNSSRTPAQVADMLAGLGIEAHSDEIVTSALATADLLTSRAGERAYVIGRDGVRAALRGVGIEVVDGAPDGVDLVVVGFDGEATYDTLRTASVLVQRGARLVATNADASFPAPDGLWPGAGALLSVITTTTGAVPEIVGKPFPPIFEAALDRAGGTPPLVVGDRLDTDVLGATRLGWDSMLVLSGVSTMADLEASDVRPTYVAPDVSALLEP